MYFLSQLRYQYDRRMLQRPVPRLVSAFGHANRDAFRAKRAAGASERSQGPTAMDGVRCECHRCFYRPWHPLQDAHGPRLGELSALRESATSPDDLSTF